jgi:CheY-like chemotaxis protein
MNVAQDHPANAQILVIEDSSSKWEEIEKVVRNVAPTAEIFHCATLVDAEAKIGQFDWDLVILDVSMDLTSSAAGPRHGGHDPLGGLRVANKMFLLGREAPTIIVTAFDAFPAGEPRRGVTEILGINDVESRATEVLGNAFLGNVHYGDADWEQKLTDLVGGALEQ